MFRLSWKSVQDLAENRRTKRRKANSRGLIVNSCLRLPLPVGIDDVSPCGARVSVENPNRVPHDFHLVNLNAGIAHEAHVVWRGSTQIGLEFSRSIVLDATVPKQLLHLRRIWLASA